MIASPRPRLQKTRKFLKIVIIFASTALLITLIVVIIKGYIFHWNWTGLVPYTSPPQPLGSYFQPGKTLWDWLQLLIIPAVLAIGGYLFNYTSSKNEQKNTQLHNQTERDIAADNQREEALQSYIDKMSELLLEKHLRESKPDDEVRKIGRVRTLTTLPRLDNTRKGRVLQFLYESNLIEKDKCIIALSKADLSGADLNRADLKFAFMRRTNLSNTNLSNAFLWNANLSEANLSGANLSGADLFGADLSVIYMARANSIGANLSNANLSNANLSNADLWRANLSGADLSKAKVTTQQLDTAKSVNGVILPDGTKHL